MQSKTTGRQHKWGYIHSGRNRREHRKANTYRQTTVLYIGKQIDTQTIDKYIGSKYILSTDRYIKKQINTYKWTTGRHKE